MGMLQVLRFELQKFRSLEMRSFFHVSNGPQHGKTCLWWLANNKGADQPAHPPVWSAPLLFMFWKVPYVNLLQVDFQFSS